MKKIQVKQKFCRTKIICTLGPAVDTEELLEGLIKEGLDGARFNFSHGNHQDHKERLDRFRKVEQKMGVKIPVLLDTKGPEIRTGKFAEPVILQEGQTFTFTIKDDVIGDINHCSISHKGIVKDVKPGDSILIDDGLVEVKVEKVTDTDVICKVINSGKVNSNKGVNLPGIKTSLPSLTEKDIGDLKFGAENGFDFVAASFIRTKEDCLNIKKYLSDFGAPNMKLIAKIENQEGIDNFDKILEVSDGIMVARGDLGVEIPIERIPIEQKKMIRKCCKAGKIVITATQMLDSMIVNPRPTRAEVTDISNAIIDGTSVVMLSGETASGKHPIEAVRYMNTIALETEKHLNLNELTTNMKELANHDLSKNECFREAINFSVAVTANVLKATAIICVTEGGKTAMALSKLRPKAPIFAITANEDTARFLSLYWSVQPAYIEKYTGFQDLVQRGIEQFKAMGFLQSGDMVATSSGFAQDTLGAQASMVGGIMKIK